MYSYDRETEGDTHTHSHTHEDNVITEAEVRVHSHKPRIMDSHHRLLEARHKFFPRASHRREHCPAYTLISA